MSEKKKINPFLRREVNMFGPGGMFDTSLFGGGSGSPEMMGNFDVGNILGQKSGTGVGLMQGSGAGAGITGGVTTGAEGAGGAAGGMGVGAYSAVAGVLGDGLQAISGLDNNGIASDVHGGIETTFNKKGVGLARYDTNVTRSHAGGEAVLKTQQREQGILSAVEQIPIIGGFSKLGRGLHQTANDLTGGVGTDFGAAVDNMFNPAGYAKRAFDNGDTMRGLVGLTGLGGLFYGEQVDEQGIIDERRNEFQGVQTQHYNQVNQNRVGNSFAFGGEDPPTLTQSTQTTIDNAPTPPLTMEEKSTNVKNRIAETVFKRESSKNWGVVNKGGYSGGYQISVDGLAEAGIMNQRPKGTSQNAWLKDPKNWKTNPDTGKKYTHKEFLNNPALQTKAINKHWDIKLKYLRDNGLIDNNTSEEDMRGFLMSAHLVGQGSTVNYYDSVAKAEAAFEDKVKAAIKRGASAEEIQAMVMEPVADSTDGNGTSILEYGKLGREATANNTGRYLAEAGETDLADYNINKDMSKLYETSAGGMFSPDFLESLRPGTVPDEYQVSPAPTEPGTAPLQPGGGNAPFALPELPSEAGPGYAEGGIMDIQVGGTHEQNPQGGINIGEGTNGKPNLVEEGEVVWGNKVFTNRF